MVINGLFFLSTFLKIPDGAFWSFFIASILLIIIVTFIRGQDKLHNLLKPIPLEDVLPKYRETYASLNKIRGSALYFMGDVRNISPYLTKVFFQNEIMYENNALASINITHNPFGVETDLDCNPAPGLHEFAFTTGYMEVVDIVALWESAFATSSKLSVAISRCS
jgi:K+ transporter